MKKARKAQVIQAENIPSILRAKTIALLLRGRAFAKLAGSCTDFPEILPNQAANLKRD
jgi:hypothetical protein